MAENIIGEFVNAVELMQPTTIDWDKPKVRAVGVDELGNIKWGPAGENNERP